MSFCRKKYILIMVGLVAACTSAYSQEQDLFIQETIKTKIESPVISAPVMAGSIMSAPTMSSPMFSDSLKWQYDMKMSSRVDSYAPMTTMGFARTRTLGNIVTWNKGFIEGGSQFDTMIGLMNRQQVTINIVQRYGNFSFALGASASKYALPVDGQLERQGIDAVQNQFGVYGFISYKFSDYVSATIYGQYVNNPFFHSMAAFPYITTSSYGGFITLQNSNVGVDLGVNNYYDPFSRSWQTDPIVRPSFKIGKIKTNIDFGPVIKEGLIKLTGKKRQQGPIIMPSK